MQNQLKFSVVIALLIGNVVWASDFQSARTAALGGAGHAGPLDADAIYLNPSYVSLVPIYSIGLDYFMARGDSPNPSDYHDMGYNVSLQDGRSELFQAGVGYTERPDAQMLNFGASKQFVDKLGTGIGEKYYHARGISDDSFWDSILSTTYVINNTFQTAFIIDNLLDSATERAHNFYREFILGTKINIKGLLIFYIDPHLAPNAATAWGYEAGTELPIFEDFFLRGGAFKQSSIDFADVRGNGFSIGAGWIAPKVSFDYAFQHVIVPIEAYQHVFGITFLL